MKRHKTDYPGVFYREAERIGGKGLERVYYIVFKQDGKVFEEKAGRQLKDHMTPAGAGMKITLNLPWTGRNLRKSPKLMCTGWGLIYCCPWD